MFVQASGTIIKAGGKVVKNVAGYDINKLYIASYGTLGVITEVSFKLFPKPAIERTMLLNFNQHGSALRVATEISQSQLLPVFVSFFLQVFLILKFLIRVFLLELTDIQQLTGKLTRSIQ